MGVYFSEDLIKIETSLSYGDLLKLAVLGEDTVLHVEEKDAVAKGAKTFVEDLVGALIILGSEVIIEVEDDSDILSVDAFYDSVKGF